MNAAAYTAVDRAEGEPEAARRLNAEVPALLAEESARSGIVPVHYSTDYVLGGDADLPYEEAALPPPRNVYGRTKLEGDRAILASGARAYVFRLSWVYGLRGSNFLRTVRRLALDCSRLMASFGLGLPPWEEQLRLCLSSIPP